MIVFPFQLICNPESKLIPKESQTDWAKSLSSWPLTHFLQQWRKKQQSNLHHKVKVCICSEHTWRGRYTSKTRLPHLPPIPPPLPPVIQLIPYGHSRNKCHTITHTHTQIQTLNPHAFGHPKKVMWTGRAKITCKSKTVESCTNDHHLDLNQCYSWFKLWNGSEWGWFVIQFSC